MTKIYSKQQPSKLLHIIYRNSDAKSGREDICPADQFLQIAALRPEQGTTYKPHRHLWYRYNDDRVTQESWIVIRGNVRVILYDIDNTAIHEDVLTPGDLSCTFIAGHTYEILTEDAMIYEVKNGPYFGQEADKIFI